MNLLFRIVYAAHANGTHHKLALDALRHLESPDAERWRRLFLKHAEVYLEGSKAPDKQFKDFKNHVLHVGDNYWGGAPEKVESWYGKLVESLKAQSWHEAVWAAGIMSHYYTDPIHPFHTAQSTAENEIHRAVEWSMSKSYGALAQRNRGRPLPVIETGSDAAWIKDHVIAGAELSNRHYETIISHYDFHRGVVEPADGLDEVLKALTADLLLYAAAGHARLLDRAFKDAGVEPPEVALTAETVIAALKIPVKWLTNKLEDMADRRQVEAIYDELTSTGKVAETLPEDDAQVRDLYEREVVGKRNAERSQQRRERRANSPLPQGQVPRLASASPPPHGRSRPAVTAPVPAPPTPVAAVAAAARPATSVPATIRPASDEERSPAGAGREPLQRIRERVSTAVPVTAAAASHGAARSYLSTADDLEAAPSIGRKTASRFQGVGIETVGQFLDADPVATSAAIGSRYITADAIVRWQQQARLVCDVPGLRGGQAQLLVGAGLASVDALADADAGQALAAILRFVQTSEGQDILRDGEPPDVEQIHAWVLGARDAKKAA